MIPVTGHFPLGTWQGFHTHPQGSHLLSCHWRGYGEKTLLHSCQVGGCVERCGGGAPETICQPTAPVYTLLSPAGAKRGLCWLASQHICLVDMRPPSPPAVGGFQQPSGSENGPSSLGSCQEKPGDGGTSESLPE